MSAEMPASKRILIIEDDADIRSVIQRILSSAGYEVEDSPFLASDVGKALSGNYDLITLDIKMPAIDGAEVVQLFQSKGLKTPVLVIAAHLDELVVEQLRKAGIRHFLSKPFRMAELLEAVEKALAGKA